MFFKKASPQVDRLELFETRTPKILAREFRPEKLSLDQRVERLELIHVDAIAQFEQSFIMIDRPEGPVRVQVLLVCPVTKRWVVRKPSGEILLVPGSNGNNPVRAL